MRLTLAAVLSLFVAFGSWLIQPPSAATPSETSAYRLIAASANSAFAVADSPTHTIETAKNGHCSCECCSTYGCVAAAPAPPTPYIPALPSSFPLPAGPLLPTFGGWYRRLKKPPRLIEL